MIWQRRLRLVIAVAAVAFAVVVALAFRHRPPVQQAASVARTDPKAVVESASGRTLRINREHEEVRIDYDRLLSYQDGSSKMLGVKVITERAGGRTFTLTGKEGEVADRESNVSVTGHVEMAASDGMTIHTEQATYTEADGMVRAPGAVEFAHDRTTGTGLGMTYDKNSDILIILDRVSMHMAPDEKGDSVQVDAGTAEFDRAAKTIHFDRALKAVRGGETMEADMAVAHLTEDEQRLTSLELRGHSQVTPMPSGEGGLQALQGRDIDVSYGPDGQTIQHAVIGGEAAIQFAGDRGRAGRRITASSIDVTLAPDGVTPTMLVARESVQLALPAEPGMPGRTIAADTMDGHGEAGRGLTSAHFTGNAQFRERGAAADRSAHSGVLDVKLAPGAGAIEEADFSRAVRFEQDDLKADAAAAHYVIASDTLQLTGSEPGSAAPHMDNDRIVVDAARIEVTLAGPKVDASGTVKSVLRPPKSDGSGKPPDSKVPSMLKPDQPVNVIGDRLEYDGAMSLAHYTGNAQLWQGDTTIKGSSITIDDKNGDLTAVAAATHTIMNQTDADQKQERVSSTGAAEDFRYQESERRATYTGKAHLIGSQGDLTASTIELYLKESGDEIDRLEGYDEIVLLEQTGRKTKGARLSYFSADERYVVTGRPVTVRDECKREQTGRTLTFYRTTDRIVLDGNERVRTQTKGTSNCP